MILPNMLPIEAPLEVLALEGGGIIFLFGFFFALVWGGAPVIEFLIDKLIDFFDWLLGYK